MGVVTKISWCDSTFNPWRGCSKVSPGCSACYAERDSKRNPALLGVWGPNGTRVLAADSQWKGVRKWNDEARAERRTRRVFCASIADVFEQWDGPVVDAQGNRLFSYVDVNGTAIDGSVGLRLDDVRIALFKLIRETPWLDWLLLTKRIDDVIPTLYRLVGRSPHSPEREMLGKWLHGIPPENVWLGTSVESRDYIGRINVLRHIPAVVRFVSAEPLLGDLGDVDLDRIHWVIAGGESGPNARPMHLQWVRNLRDLCIAQGVAYHFKQWGEWIPDGQGLPFLKDVAGARGAHVARALLPDGRHMPDLTGRGTNGDDTIVVRRVGKKAAGRLLDGRTWDQVPSAVAVA